MTLIKRITQSLIVLSMLTTISVTAYGERDRYDHDTKENYKRYKSFAAPKKKRLLNKWEKFKKESDWDNLSPAERRRLKERVMREGH